jgi:hypothetical protein
MLAKVIKQVTEPKYYVARPPGMVNSMKAYCAYLKSILIKFTLNDSKVIN